MSSKNSESRVQSLDFTPSREANEDDDPSTLSRTTEHLHSSRQELYRRSPGHDRRTSHRRRSTSPSWVYRHDIDHYNEQYRREYEGYYDVSSSYDRVLHEKGCDWDFCYDPDEYILEWSENVPVEGNYRSQRGSSPHYVNERRELYRRVSNPVRHHREDLDSRDCRRRMPTVPCRYYDAGNCTRGSQCTFLHDRSRSVRKEDWDVQYERRDKYHDRKFARLRMNTVEETGFVARRNLKTDAEVNVQPCRQCIYFSKGRCRNGLACGYMHQGSSPRGPGKGVRNKNWSEKMDHCQGLQRGSYGQSSEDQAYPNSGHDDIDAEILSDDCEEVKTPLDDSRVQVDKVETSYIDEVEPHEDDQENNVNMGQPEYYEAEDGHDLGADVNTEHTSDGYETALCEQDHGHEEQDAVIDMELDEDVQDDTSQVESHNLKENLNLNESPTVEQQVVELTDEPHTNSAMQDTQLKQNAPESPTDELLPSNNICNTQPNQNDHLSQSDELLPCSHVWDTQRNVNMSSSPTADSDSCTSLPNPCSETLSGFSTMPLYLQGINLNLPPPEEPSEKLVEAELVQKVFVPSDTQAVAVKDMLALPDLVHTSAIIPTSQNLLTLGTASSPPRLCGEGEQTSPDCNPISSSSSSFVALTLLPMPNRGSLSATSFILRSTEVTREQKKAYDVVSDNVELLVRQDAGNLQMLGDECVDVPEDLSDRKASANSDATKSEGKMVPQDSVNSIGSEGRNAGEKDSANSVEMHPVASEGARKWNDEKLVRKFKFELVEMVKEFLKPAWRDGHISKEQHKAIVKKVVDMVMIAMHGPLVPNTVEEVHQYLEFSKSKLENLVQAQVEPFVRR